MIITGLWFDDNDADENWMRAFEAYGHAMACASALELQLALVLSKTEKLKLGKRYKNERTDNEMLAYANSLSRQPFEKLIPKLRRAFTISKELVEALEIARSGRNALAHQFWQYQLGNLSSESGVEIIAKECATHVWHFQQTSLRVTMETGVNVHDYAHLVRAKAPQMQAEWNAKLGDIIN